MTMMVMTTNNSISVNAEELVIGDRLSGGKTDCELRIADCGKGEGIGGIAELGMRNADWDRKEG